MFVSVAVGSEEARRSASLRPPLKPYVQFSRIRLSQQNFLLGFKEGIRWMISSSNEWTFFSPVGLSQSLSFLGWRRTGFSLNELFLIAIFTHSLIVSSNFCCQSPSPSHSLALASHLGFPMLQVLFDCPTPQHASLSTSSKTYRSVYLGAIQERDEVSLGRV